MTRPLSIYEKRKVCLLKHNHLHNSTSDKVFTLTKSLPHTHTWKHILILVWHIHTAFISVPYMISYFLHWNIMPDYSELQIQVLKTCNEM
jgi:hypothetical protein